MHLFSNTSPDTDWVKWLPEVEAFLKERGYRKYNQEYKREDFAYWKTFRENEKKVYQVGILFYDFRKYVHRDENTNRIGTQYECLMLNNGDMNMSCYRDIELEEFEEIAKTFYETFKIH